MEEHAQPPPDAAVSPFLTRATNVFASPGELYSEVASSPVQTSSWALPYIISLVLTVLLTVALFNNPSLRQQLLDTQKQEIQHQVDAGKMPQETADRSIEFLESSSMVMIIGMLAAVLFVTIALFGIPLVLWLVAKFGLKAAINYNKMLEVYGLATLIGILGGIVSVLLMHVFSSVYATPGGSMFFMSGGFNSHNVLHNILASLSLFAIWQAVVAGVGMAKISGKTTGTGIGIVLGLWFLWVILVSFLGWGIR
jgi:hypothetical protein